VKKIGDFGERAAAAKIANQPPAISRQSPAKNRTEMLKKLQLLEKIVTLISRFGFESDVKMHEGLPAANPYKENSIYEWR
jgi:hypothetical protein